MATLQNIIDMRGRFLEFDLDDCYGDSPTTAQQVESVNWAIRTISAKIHQFDPSIPLTLVAGTNLYNLRGTLLQQKVVKPYQIVIGGQLLRDASCRDYGIWSLPELERFAPQWRTDPSSTPTKAVDFGNGKLLLHPTPDAGTAALNTHFVSGTYLAANMTTADLAASPDLPEELHEAVAFLAAFHSAISRVTESEGWQRLNAYNQEWQAIIDETARRNMSAIESWGSTPGSDYSDYVFI